MIYPIRYSEQSKAEILIIDEVRLRGDDALRRYTLLYDGVAIQDFAVTDEEFAEAMSAVGEEYVGILRRSAENIASFHRSQLREGFEIEQEGCILGQKVTPLESAGIYVPGGKAAYPSTVLMNAVPAAIAGVKRIVMVTPPLKDGKIKPEVLVAAKIAGITEVYKVGGAQAVAALAYGTQSIKKVDKITGPGNIFVATAKKLVYGVCGIDMIAGPSEILIIADGGADAENVAADLLSQAEHGIDSQVLLITTSAAVAEAVEKEVTVQLEALPRKDIARKALDNSKIVIVDSDDEAMELSNMYAPEHLIIATENCERLASKVVNAGSVFLGKYACESAGDYASGTNHTLPTNGYATAYSGVNLDSFNRKITFQHITPEGVKSIGRAVEVMAENEQLMAHKNAMTIRMK